MSTITYSCNACVLKPCTLMVCYDKNLSNEPDKCPILLQKVKWELKSGRNEAMKVPWSERVPAISINPDMATRDDVARLATEYMEARHELCRLMDIVSKPDRESIEKVLEG